MLSDIQKYTEVRPVINRKQLISSIKNILIDKSDKNLRLRLLKLFKKNKLTGENKIAANFKKNKDGIRYTISRARLVDQLIMTLYEIALNNLYNTKNKSNDDLMVLVALGGYGRLELAPSSDVDLLIVISKNINERLKKIIEFLLYMLWDMGFKVGHAVRNIESSIMDSQKDAVLASAMLDMRFIVGDHSLFLKMQNMYHEKVVLKNGNKFFESKLLERDTRHERMGDSRYLVEPNIKESIGGLRDLHTFFWISKYLYGAKTLKSLIEKRILKKEEARIFKRSLSFLLRLRCHMHILTGRAEDRLTFDIQGNCAELMGYVSKTHSRKVERFMKHYFLIAKDIGDLTKIIVADLKSRQTTTITSKIRQGKHLKSGGNPDFIYNEFSPEGMSIIKMFELVADSGKEIHPDLLRKFRVNLNTIDIVRKNKEANIKFINILTSKKYPSKALRSMNESGVLGRFVPDFGKIVAQMQHDMYHVYTVDEHSIFALEQLSLLESGKYKHSLLLASKLIKEIVSRRVLYTAVFIHDIAKGRGGDHSLLGSKIAVKLGKRFSFDSAEIDTLSWLVKHHLLLSHVAFKRDINDPKTVIDLVEIIKSPERLKLLYILTIVDIRAVGPNVWNDWKGGLLEQLFRFSLHVMSGGSLDDVHGSKKEKLYKSIFENLNHWPDDILEKYSQRFYPYYWNTLERTTQVHHAELILTADSKQNKYAVDVKVDPLKGATVVTIYFPDHHGLFARAAGAIALSGGNIVDARIAMTRDGMAIDTFFVQTSNLEPILDPQKRNLIKRNLEKIITEEQDSLTLLSKLSKNETKRTSVFTVEPRVLIDNKASRTHTVLEINAKDRLGILCNIAQALVELRLSISTARIATYGESVVDVFYVQDLTGMKIMETAKLNNIKRVLLEALSKEI